MKFNAIATLHVRGCTRAQKNQMAAVAIATLGPVWESFYGQPVDLMGRETREGDMYIGHFIITPEEN